MSFRKHAFAVIYRRLLSDGGHPNLQDAMTRDVRLPLLEQAGGDVLEIGAGDGANLALYPEDVRVILLEPNPYLLRHAPDIASRTHPRQGAIPIQAVGEAMPFPGDHFDTVVSLHVLCSVGSQGHVLSEILRVLKAGGRFLFMEHVAAPNGTWVRRLQRVMNPAWSTIGDGCRLTQETGQAIRQAGFREVQIERFEAPYPVFVKPHIAGTAVK